MNNSYEKHSTIEEELEWYEENIRQLKASIDGIDLANLKDRTGLRESPKGGAYPVVVATIEQIRASYILGMKEMPKLLNALDDLRNKYKEKEFMTRGNIEMKNTGMDFVKKLPKKEDE